MLRRVSDCSESGQDRGSHTRGTGGETVVLCSEDHSGLSIDINLHVDRRMAGVSRNIRSVMPFCGEEGTAVGKTIR